MTSCADISFSFFFLTNSVHHIKAEISSQSQSLINAVDKPFQAVGTRAKINGKKASARLKTVQHDLTREKISIDQS